MAKVSLKENEPELLFRWRGLSQDAQWRIIGRIDLYLEQAREKDGADKKEPKENNVVSLKKEV